ncbi:MAG: penicillin-binding protein 2 [Proteobacteria bacterium]|nr:penicillin-binding protein 2 [Pseudomonadota bacterium]
MSARSGDSARPASMEGTLKLAMETARNRLMVAVFLFAGAFMALGFRTIGLGLMQDVSLRSGPDRALSQVIAARADIVDRNGVVLATNLQTASLYADPRRVFEPEIAAARLAAVLPELSQSTVLEKLKSNRRFVWIRRKLTPRQMWRVNALGLPGFSFQMEEHRVYPQGSLAAHVVGYVDVDGRGLGGIEYYFDDRLGNPADASEPLVLSIDSRIQHALADELKKAAERFGAAGAAGIVMNINSGAVLGMVSVPDFDPNHANLASGTDRFNRATAAVYELGSTFKTFTIAAALETGTVRLTDSYDASEPIRIARYTISDNHPQNRMLTVPEIYTYSSNIGAARMALDLGRDRQRAFLAGLGLLRAAVIELPEVGRPIFPQRWGDVHTMTIAYGHGIAVSPLQLTTAIAAMVNGGTLIPATLVDQPRHIRPAGRRVISAHTSDDIRMLMRLAVTSGTGRQADVPGYRVGGKTGTAEKSGVGGYRSDALVSSFIGVFPMDAPEFVVFALLDEPKGRAETLNFAGGGWVSAPVVRNVIARIAPILGVEPKQEDESHYRQAALLIRESD